MRVSGSKTRGRGRGPCSTVIKKQACAMRAHFRKISVMDTARWSGSRVNRNTQAYGRTICDRASANMNGRMRASMKENGS